MNIYYDYSCNSYKTSITPLRMLCLVTIDYFDLLRTTVYLYRLLKRVQSAWRSLRSRPSRLQDFIHNVRLHSDVEGNLFERRLLLGFVYHHSNSGKPQATIHDRSLSFMCLLTLIFFNYFNACHSHSNVNINSLVFFFSPLLHQLQDQKSNFLGIFFHCTLV